MKKENIISTDVLIVGGGPGGVITAIKAAKAGLEVLIADKVHVGGGGMAPRAGHGLICIEEGEEAVERYVEYHARKIGDYADDQDMVRQYARSLRPVYHEMLEWGVQLTTDKNGEIGMFSCPNGVPWYQVGVQLHMMLPLRKQATNEGVKLKEHFHITGLLKDGERICGACGYDVYDGSFSVINAKAVVLATAGCGYKNTSMFNACGEGNRLAYEAGAKMRSAEFGNFYENYAVRKGNAIYGGYPFTFNSKGENMWDKYIHWDAPDMTAVFYRGFVNEYLSGNGPMYIDLDVMEEAMRNGSDWAAMGQHADLEAAAQGTGMIRYFDDKLKQDAVFAKKQEESGVELGRKPEVKLGMHGNTGCIRVDHDFQTSVPGLFAVGLTVWNGSGIGGAVGQPGMQHGNGIGTAAVTAYMCVPKLIEFVKNADRPKVDESQAESIRQDTYAPVENKKGYDAHDMIPEVQDCITPIKYNLLREESRLQEAIDKLVVVENEKLSNLHAKDWHDLMVCNEVISMARTGEIMMRAAKERKESRGFHIREDYPERDDKNWMKWTNVQKINGEMVVSTEDIPIETYKYRPDNEK